ncbi:glucocorticoid modulatory element-binding protein 2 isoform X2 [Antennarius striatus]|uniref:glucocorticoid modulatory element-binding protein 2 isoform X2 n=1 Tax=Antennarius striatus TaxID=241820 RepID=UPI0035AF3B1F
MSEVVIVTIPEPAAEDLQSGTKEDKVLVTAELTAREDIFSVATEKAEAEANKADSLSKEDGVIVKLAEEVDVETDVVYPVTCGDAKAMLVWKKFVCPGINVKCVLFNDQLISPKEFVCLAGKSTLKDWKRAIRLNGTMIRKIMDSGELDFYQHTKVCSNTCRSTKIDLVGTKVSINSDKSAELIPVPSSAGYAVLLNSIVQNFGLLDLVKKVLASHKSQMDRYREQYTRSLATLEQQCDEHRKRAKELKSKSQHLNNVLMTLTPVSATPALKRPRLTRAVSGPASISAVAPKQISLPINQLTGLPLGKVLTVAGAQTGTSLGGYTLLTSALSTSEVQSDASNLALLSTTLGQEGAVSTGGTASTAFVKVVGPQFQLVTLPATIQSLATKQSTVVQQQVASVSVMDGTAINTQVACQDVCDEGQPEQDEPAEQQ